MSDYITEVDIVDESKECFLTYAEEVLTDRAVPNAEDGLLSVHRKLLWTMERILKLNSKSKYKKSASIVGSTLASSYFHGDSACYGALCKLAQPYLMRYPLVDGDGNFGSQEANGMEASARYTNCRPSIYADLMLNDFEKDVVPLKETYNGEYMEPVILPSMLPNALINGRESIAIGLSHNSLPNNLNEVCDGIIAYLNNSVSSTKELMKYIKGPDFPLGNVVINKNDIEEAFKTGHSSVSLKVRGDYYIDKNEIIFTSIPYRTYRNKIKEQLSKNADKIEEFIEDFDDESNIGKNRLVFKVKKGIDPERAVLELFNLTDLQITLSYNMNFIVDGTPKMCNLQDLIKSYINHQYNVFINAAKYDKDKAEKRIHIIKGLLKAVDQINEVINIIKQSSNTEEATNILITFLQIDEIQAKAILEMKLKRLTKIDKNELINELVEKEKIVKECDNIILFESYRKDKLIKQLLFLKEKYGDERRTKLMQLNIPTSKEKEKALVKSEDVIVVLSQSGKIKRIPKKSFKTQSRGTKGIKSEDSAILSSISTNTTDNLLLFSSKGRMYSLLIDKIPEGTNRTKGESINNFINLDTGEEIIAATAANSSENKYIVFFTKKGLIKKSLVSEYTTARKSIQAIKLKEGDSIVNIAFINEEDVIILTRMGLSIHFATAGIKAIGRVSTGVKAIELAENDEVLIGLPIKEDDKFILSMSIDNKGKRVGIKQFPLQTRGGKGVLISKQPLIGALVSTEESDKILLNGANSLCIEASEFPIVVNRISTGNIISKGDVRSIIKL